MMRQTRLADGLAALGLTVTTGPAAAQDAPYAGMDTRAIASLSQADVDANLAELGGHPGPLHVLELADALALTDAQRAEVQAVQDTMKTDARATRKRHVEAEPMLSGTQKEIYARERGYGGGHGDADHGAHANH